MKLKKATNTASYSIKDTVPAFETARNLELDYNEPKVFCALKKKLTYIILKPKPRKNNLIFIN
ncbi:9637_t:CDS:2 [Entrophospora sp. SA101]|nr:9637_t:CDS:2 [Entrophospora sp. SA101]